MPVSDLPDCDPPPHAPTAPARRLPPGTCDTHFHVFGPPERYPLDPRRNYTPHACSLDDYRRVMQALGIERAVLVQPSVYGTDNRALLDALREGGPAFRAVAVVAGGVGDEELAQMHDLGVRGVRLNLVNPQMVDLPDTLAILRRMAGRGWHLQVQIDLAREPGKLRAVCEQAGVPVVVDHMGKLAPATRSHPLLDLLREGECWVKLSAPYRVSAQPAPHDDLAGLVRALVDANPQRVLWGSDWPHVELHHGTPGAGSLADLVQAWCPDAVLLRQICVANPARLYGFPPVD